MRASSLFQDIVASLFERGATRTYADKKGSLEQLCQDLITERGEVSGYAYAQAILERYSGLDERGKIAFFTNLNTAMDIDREQLEASAQAYANDPSPDNYKSLTRSCEPMRRELLNRINQLPGATERLVDMRADLLRFCKSDPTLKKTDQDFQHLFRSWFNRGFLVLRQINWTTPANILEKIIKYEAVHAIGDWDDLRRRLQPNDRRCFAFFHPSIPDDPLIFVEVALCKGIPNSIQTLLSDKRKILDNDRADTAVFYSISNCQVGLAGISFGNSLIKQVVRDLSGELPNLETFVTLSPMPGFADWLGLQAKAGKESLAARLLAACEEALADGKADVLQTLEPQLLLLGAHYLSSKKHPDGLPLDPVERFHLSNGAMIHDIHAGADMSHNGLKQSCGLMANYLYDLRKVETNHEEFARKGIINASRKLENLARQKLA